MEGEINILLGCEESQAVTIEFRKLGFKAWSCDLKPCSGGHPEWHLQMDVFKAIKLKRWSLGIFFPDCTFLTCSAEWAYEDGPYHQRVRPDTLVGLRRREARKDAIKFVKSLWNSGIPFVGIENPVGVLTTQWRSPSQIIQPYSFGEDASKATCLWLKGGLPKLRPTKYIRPRLVNGKRWSNQTDSGQNKLYPSENRAELRSKTYPGIAKAMAEQWSKFLISKPTPNEDHPRFF